MFPSVSRSFPLLTLSESSSDFTESISLSCGTVSNFSVRQLLLRYHANSRQHHRYHSSQVRNFPIPPATATPMAAIAITPSPSPSTASGPQSNPSAVPTLMAPTAATSPSTSSSLRPSPSPPPAAHPNSPSKPVPQIRLPHMPQALAPTHSPSPTPSNPAIPRPTSITRPLPRSLSTAAPSKTPQAITQPSRSRHSTAVIPSLAIRPSSLRNSASPGSPNLAATSCSQIKSTSLKTL